MKICAKCKTNKDSTEFYVNKRRGTLYSWCKKCSKLESKRWTKNALKDETSVTGGLTRLAKILHVSCRNRNNCTKSIGMTELRKIYESQAGKCYYTGIPMKLASYSKDPLLMSIDRIDYKIGYDETNIVLCCLGMNWLKNIHDETTMFNALKLFYEGAKSNHKI